MCGITGLFDLKERRDVDRSLIARMNRSQVHRGPDEEGTYFEPGVGLGHQRLSIIDIKSGQQPLFNEDGTVAVVYNGEIYNFQPLVTELTELGHQFRTRCDTEVIVHAWEEWGEECVARFRGMFAFAIWDSNKQCIFLARDRLGVKPLFYSELKNGWLAFGSELKALAALPDFDKEIDPLAVEEYFALGYAAEPRTIYRRTLKLPPASHLTIRKGQPLQEPKEYWDVRFTVDNPITLEDAMDELRERLTESVKLRMIADVPLGAFLSGGVDSSAVVALMSSLSASPVNTCSIAFDDPSFNESEFAQSVADRYSTNHYSKTVAADDFGLVDKLAGFYDEPYADSSAIPTYRVCELARQRVKVALSGDGADEIFGGYRRYRLHLMEEGLRSKLPLGLRRPVFGLLGKLYPKADWAPRFLRAKTTFEGLARDSVQGYLHSVSILSDAMRAQLYSPRMKSELAGYSALDVFRRHENQADTDDPLALIQYIDIKTYLVGDINTKVDRASMAHSLEVREPLMDQELVEWVATLPSRLKHRRGEGKFVLKKTLEPLLPNDVLYRPKMGFAVPLASWFRGPLADRVKESLLGERLQDTGLFNRSYLEHLVTAHQSGRRDYSASIWTVLMYEAFLRGQEASPNLAESG